MTHKNIVSKQIALGFLGIALTGILLWLVFPTPAAPDRVSYTLSWAVLFSLPLILGIHKTLFARFNSSELIKGYQSTTQATFETAYLNNTVEQTLVNVLTAISLGMVVPISLIKLVPIQACIFIIGRVLYFFTYQSNPMNRFTGFVMTYYVALLSAVLSVYWAIFN